VISCECCEELWTPNNPNVAYGLDGVEIIGNGSGSHHELRKLEVRLQLLQSASSRNGGVYLYSNLKGCDGGRMYFDGASIIQVNGKIVSQMPQFSLPQVEVSLGAIDLDEVRQMRISTKGRC